MTTSSRIAVRVILLDPSSRVLLFEGRDLSDISDTVRFWFTAGGGVEENESLVQAAERELAEETGLTGAPLVGPFHRREVDFLNHGELIHQTEHFFAARITDLSGLRRDGWTELERTAMTQWQWWSGADLRTDAITFFPEDLPALVERAAELVYAVHGAADFGHLCARWHSTASASKKRESSFRGLLSAAISWSGDSRSNIWGCLGVGGPGSRLTASVANTCGRSSGSVD